MQTDVAWHPPIPSQQDRDALNGQDDTQHMPQLHEQWDPSSAFLNQNMNAGDYLLPAQNSFEAAGNSAPNILPQHNALAPSAPAQYSQIQHMQYAHRDNHDHSYDVFQPNVQPVFDPARFHPAQPGSASDHPNAQSANPAPLQHEFLYPQMQQPFGQSAHPAQAHLDYSTPPLTPNGSAISPHRTSGPQGYAISPASNQSFAAQQDFSSFDAGRPSTADSVHSLRAEYPPDDYSFPNAHPNGSGVVPSALHPFNQRNYIQMAPDPSHHPFTSHHPQPQHTISNASRPYVQNVNPPGHPFGFNPASNFHPEQGIHVTPHVLDDHPPLFPPATAGPGSDIASFIRPTLHQYVEARNRIAFGERTVIVMASKVAQKSYGQERRFLCPPPTAIMIGNTWWSDTAPGRDDRKPPRVTISISGETTPPECVVEWTSTAGKSVDHNEPPIDGVTYMGRAVGKQLFISDERQKKVEALVKIVAPAGEDEPERIIGTFPSRPIKVISKPSKKRQSAKNMELCINHGSTVSLFHRLRSQTVSTKYLCVSGSNSSFRGSDGELLPGVDPMARTNPPSFVARTGTWDPFIIYIVDVTKPVTGPGMQPPPPLMPEYPSPPPNAISYLHHGAHTPIYYNQTVVLQCLTSGVVSPVLIIRKVDHDTIVVGGGLQEGAKGVPEHFCAPGEVCGDPVSQLHKVAFEVYDPNKVMHQPNSPGITGAFLSCMGEKVNTYRPSEGRQWNHPEASSGSQSPSLPDSPAASSNGSLTDYFSPNGSPTGSAPNSPLVDQFSSDGGRVRRGKRSGSGASAPPMVRTTSKARRRVNSVGSAGGNSPQIISPSTRYGLADQAMSSGALWSIDIGESAVWTIVGTEQIRYNFYVPPSLPGTIPSVPNKPVTPFPTVVKYLPPDRAAENPMKHMSARQLVKPDPRSASLLTVYGENFDRNDPPIVFFGAEPSPYVDVRCQEVLACRAPEVKTEAGIGRPIFLVRSDGIIYPSSVQYYSK